MARNCKPIFTKFLRNFFDPGICESKMHVSAYLDAKRKGSPFGPPFLYQRLCCFSRFPVGQSITLPGLTAALALDQAFSKAAQSRTGRIAIQIS